MAAARATFDRLRYRETATEADRRRQTNSGISGGTHAKSTLPGLPEAICTGFGAKTQVAEAQGLIGRGALDLSFFRQIVGQSIEFNGQGMYAFSKIGGW